MAASRFAPWSDERTRLSIHRRAGINERADTGLSKRALLSVGEYLTGEFACPPAHVYKSDVAPDDRDQVPAKRDLQEAVAVAAVEELGDSELAESLKEWTEVLDHVGPRPFEGDELTAILEAMDRSGDRRPVPEP